MVLTAEQTCSRALFIGFEKLNGCECPMSNCDPFAIFEDEGYDLKWSFNP
jgi:hypothetical protein